MRQVLRAGALGRPRGMGWGGRWEGGSGWGTHVNPWLIHVNVWQKPLQYCKVISLKLMKINGGKKDGNDNRICKTEQETQMYRTDFWTLREKARVGCSERITLKQVYYQG